MGPPDSQCCPTPTQNLPSELVMNTCIWKVKSSGSGVQGRPQLHRILGRLEQHETPFQTRKPVGKAEQEGRLRLGPGTHVSYLGLI